MREREREREIIFYSTNPAYVEVSNVVISLLLPGSSRRRTRIVPFCRISSYHDSNYGSPLLVNISNISRRTFCRAFSARDGRFCRRNKFTREKTNQQDGGIMQFVLLARIRAAAST